MKISPVLDGAAAFLGNHVFANPKLIPERERGEIKGDNVGEWCVLSLSSARARVCVCMSRVCSSVCCWQRCDTLYTGAERGGGTETARLLRLAARETRRLPSVMWTWWFHLIVWLHSGDGFTRLLLRHSDFFLIYACIQITTGGEKINKSANWEQQFVDRAGPDAVVQHQFIIFS